MCLIESSCLPPVPNPILELQEWQSRSSLARIPILALERVVMVHSALKPSLLQVSCKEASGPTTDYHLPRPSEVLQYCPSAISEYRELALLVISIKLIWLLILISRQILEKGCVPGGGKFGLQWVKASLASINITAVFILPVCRGVVERFLWEEKLKIKAR